jgi:organic hydroperoxide reductase OsmC/OhrA
VDPEEALIAAASSCHMLWFLAIAAKRGHVVDSYIDDAVGFLGTQQSGKTGFTRITLHPNIEFARGREPTQAELASMHEEAHRNCYIANSLNCDIEVATGSSA